jgi:hypothetical protein
VTYAYAVTVAIAVTERGVTYAYAVTVAVAATEKE